MKSMFTFPGQGAQLPGMLHQLPDSDITRCLLREAREVLKEDPLEWDTGMALRKTRAVQLCLLIAGVAYALELKARGVVPNFVCGLSIGAFPAAVIAGALEYRTALDLVSLRGTLMEYAYPQGYGLSAIVGLTPKKIETLVNQVCDRQSPVYLANINAEDQCVIAGNFTAMNKVCELALDNGALKTHRLAVSIPSHCALLEKAAEKLAQAMTKITLQMPHIAYLSGSTGRVIWQPREIARDLAFNMARTVHWHDAMVAAKERGITLIIEMPPGAVLTKLARKVMVQGEALSVSQLGITAVTEITGYYSH